MILWEEYLPRSFILVNLALYCFFSSQAFSSFCLFIFLHYVLPSLNSQGIGHAITYLAFYIWALFVIIPISLAFYRWIEMPGIRVGELIVRRFEYFNKKRASMIVKDNQ